MADEYGPSDEYPTFKIIVIGDSNVGKSSLLVRYVEDTFSTAFKSSIGVEFKMKTIELEGKKLKLQIWDFAGSDRFVSIAKSRFQEADAIVLVYDITNKETYDDIFSHWKGQIVENNTQTHAIKYLVGNKSDLEEKRTIKADEAKSAARESQWSHMEVSAKTGQNVTQLFETIAMAMAGEYERSGKKNEEWNEEEKKKNKCCIQ